jgi:C-terminal processing protease CtpA/Prc
VLTPRRIEPERFHFINSATTLDLCRKASGDLAVSQWAPSIELSIATGEMYSQGFTLEPVEAYNRRGQQYHGPVVLIVDALCYSTTDIFSAGFQDHSIGKILGTSHRTGAGGANVWEYGLLQGALSDHFPILPGGTTFRVAIRRTTRVGDRAGVPVEDLGVEPDEIHLMTRDDILQGNADLIAHAARILAAS